MFGEDEAFEPTWLPLKDDHEDFEEAAMYDLLNPGKFVTELLQLSSEMAVMNKTKCPECGGILVKRSGNHGEFYGCVHYPVCTGKMTLNAMNQ